MRMWTRKKDGEREGKKVVAGTPQKRRCALGGTRSRLTPCKLTCSPDFLFAHLSGNLGVNFLNFTLAPLMSVLSD